MKTRARSKTGATLEKVRPLAEKGGYRIPDQAVFYAAVGCGQCRGTGYQGRIGLFEILSCNPRLVEQLLKCQSSEEMTHLHTSVCDLLAIEFPILQAGMATSTTPELVAAVSNAGGLGIIGGLGRSPDELRREIRRVRELLRIAVHEDPGLAMVYELRNAAHPRRDNRLAAGQGLQDHHGTRFYLRRHGDDVHCGHYSRNIIAYSGVAQAVRNPIR